MEVSGFVEDSSNQENDCRASAPQRLADQITLQINLSPGDVRYAQRCVPALVSAHGESVRSRIAVVDCCRPQRSILVDPDVRFPLHQFRARVDEIRAIAESLKRQGYFDEIVYLEPDDALLEELSQKYLRGIVRETHDAGGCALAAYLAALELPASRYVLHYDADMLLYQAPGYDWAHEAVRVMQASNDYLAAVPRTAPPPNNPPDGRDGPTQREGLPFWPVQGGWKNAWFSTRCFLLDREKLQEFLPLMAGRVLLETLAVKYLKRGYPRSPELMLYRRVRGRAWRLNLSTRQAWLLHPLYKPDEYISLLSSISERVARGECPDAQRGDPEVNLDAWERFVAG